MENKNGPPKPSNQNDPGVKLECSVIEKILIVAQGVLLFILFVVGLIALFPETFNNLLGRGI